MIRMVYRKKTNLLAAAGLCIAFAVAAVGAAQAAQAAPPTNDSVASPTVISAVPTTIAQNTKGATHASSDPRCVSGASVWYRFTPATAVTARIVTVGTSYDTVLAVFRGSATNANRIACSDDRIGYQSGAQVSFIVGVRYLIAVSQYSSRGSGGPMTLTLYQPRTPQISAAVTSIVAGQVSGKLFLTGTIGFNNPSIAYLRVEVDQQVGDHVVYGAASTYPTSPGGLDQEKTWAMTIQSGTGWAYAADQLAAVEVRAEAWDGWSLTRQHSTSNITVAAGAGQSVGA